MWILRLLGVLVLVAVAGGFVSYLLTGNVKYLRFAGRLFRYTLIVAFLLAYFVMGFRDATLYACVVLAALPTGQNVYNYAARYNVGLSFARDGILFSTLSSPIFIAIIAALLS